MSFTTVTISTPWRTISYQCIDPAALPDRVAIFIDAFTSLHNGFHDLQHRLTTWETKALAHQQLVESYLQQVKTLQKKLAPYRFLEGDISHKKVAVLEMLGEHPQLVKQLPVMEIDALFNEMVPFTKELQASAAVYIALRAEYEQQEAAYDQFAQAPLDDLENSPESLTINLPAFMLDEMTPLWKLQDDNYDAYGRCIELGNYFARMDQLLPPQGNALYEQMLEYAKNLASLEEILDQTEERKDPPPPSLFDWSDS